MTVSTTSRKQENKSFVPFIVMVAAVSLILSLTAITIWPNLTESTSSAPFTTPLTFTSTEVSGGHDIEIATESQENILPLKQHNVEKDTHKEAEDVIPMKTQLTEPNNVYPYQEIAPASVDVRRQMRSSDIPSEECKVESDDEIPASIIAEGRVVGHLRSNIAQRAVTILVGRVKEVTTSVFLFLRKLFSFSWIFSRTSLSLSSRSRSSTPEEVVRAPAESRTTESSPTARPTDFLNDHIYCDVSALKLEPQQLKRIHDALAHPALLSKDIQAKATTTHFDITAHLVYRYLAAVEWTPLYNGREAPLAIAETIEWRDKFGVACVDTQDIAHFVQRGVAYTSGLDKFGRAIMYVKVGRNDRTDTHPELYKKLLMYTVERADRLSETHGSGEFVAVIYLKEFTWSKCPSTAVMKECLGLLKKHYPYRLGAVIIVNAGFAFNILWKLFQPLMPRRALAKTFVFTKNEIAKKMDEKLGMYFIEEAYGGLVKEDHSDVNKYFSQGYWHGKKISLTVNVPVSIS